MSNSFRIASLHVYPIKAFGGFTPAEWPVDQLGLKYNRQWMLVDDTHRFITLRQFPHLIRYHAVVKGGQIEVTGPEGHSFAFDIEAGAQRITADIWDKKVDVAVVGDEADSWFSQLIGQPCRLVKYDDASHRVVNPVYAPEGATTSFTDGYPVLVIGSASLTDLNNRLEDKIEMERFRPSMVVSTEIPFDEDHWQAFSSGTVTFKGVKLCSRCVVTCVDPATGRKSDEPLRTLSTYRRFNNHVCFGQNALLSAPEGAMLRTGDHLDVLQRGPYMT
ncbi:MAG: MOSC domain-containing protein [Flavobacteriales bacterium]|nr:MOSC domain-containing protein [Flavobacteriales bacterium]